MYLPTACALQYSMDFGTSRWQLADETTLLACVRQYAHGGALSYQEIQQLWMVTIGLTMLVLIR